jgi:hypothetical protein
MYLMCCWILLASILLRTFASMFNRDICYHFFLLICHHLVLELEKYWLHRMSFIVFLLFVLWNRLRSIWCYFFFKGLVEFSSESVRAWIFFFEKLFTTVSFSLLMIVLLKLLMSFQFNFCGAYALRNLSIPS